MSAYDRLFRELLAQKDARERAGLETQQWFPLANELLAVSFDVRNLEAQAEVYRLGGREDLSDGLREQATALRARSAELLPLVRQLEL